MKVLISYENRQADYVISDEIVSIIEKVCKQTLKNENFFENVVIDVSFVDNNSIKDINKEFRKRDKETDVLSFPILNFKNGVLCEDNVLDFDFDNDAYILGDIVISLEKVYEQSKEFEHSFERELGFLAAHSVLHLLGYDHMEPQAEKIMDEKTEEVMKKLNLIR